MIKKLSIILLALILAGPSQTLLAEGNPRIKRLVSQLYDRKTAMDAQRRIVSYGTEATQYVTPLLKDKNNENVQISALYIIADIGDPSAEDDVIALLKDDDPRVRREAARTLSVIGTNEAAIEPLKELLDDYNPDVRYNAIKALATLARKDETDLFINGLGDYDPRVRFFSVVALGKLKSAKAVPYLAQLTRDFDPSVRMQVVIALERIGTDDCLQPLVWLMADPDVNIGMQAIRAIGQLKAKDADGVLVKAASRPNPRTASLAIEMLGRKKSPEALEAAKANIDDEHMSVKLAAIKVIGEMGGSAEKPLLEPLREAESTQVRQSAQTALGEINSRI